MAGTVAFHRQPLFFLVLGLLAGSLSPASEPTPSLFIALGVSGLLALFAIVRPDVVPLAALVVASSAAGAAAAVAARGGYEQLALPRAISEVKGAVAIGGRLATDPKIVDDEMRFDLDAEAILAEGVSHAYRGRIRVFLKSQSQSPFATTGLLRKGDEIRAWVDLRRPEPVRTPGGFDQAEWAKREGIHAFATCKSERLLQVVKAGPLGRTLVDRARDRLKASWRHVEKPLDRAVTASMVLGDEGALDATTREEFRSAGLLHLLVVSGSQVAALIVGLRWLMPLPLKIAWSGCLLEWLVLLSYCLMTGGENSIMRATLMAMAFGVGVRVDLRRDGANFLAASALVLLMLRPLDARDPGAQMSFAATLALITFAGALARKLTAWRIPGFLAEVVSATLVASIAVAPLTLMHFHRFSLIALPANLLASPLAVLLLYGSLGTAALDAVFTPAASLVGWMCGLIAEALRSLAHLAALSDPDWRGPSPPLALLVGLTLMVFLANWRRRVLPLAGLLASLSMSGLPVGDGRLHVWFLDVGQGDSILIETPNGRVAAIDAGPAFEKFDAGERVVSEALWALGHQRLSFMAITHRHADHEGGAPFLARHFHPERIYVNGESSALKGFETTTARQGDSWTIDGVRFSILGPDPAWTLPSRDENARSLVVEVRYGHTCVLLMGDASALTESLVNLPNQHCDVVKVGHHGAATSSSQRLVEGTRPRLAVMSVGTRNRFSHPNAKVVDRWSHAGALVWRTDKDHTLHLTSDGTNVEW